MCTSNLRTSNWNLFLPQHCMKHYSHAKACVSWASMVGSMMAASELGMVLDRNVTKPHMC